MTSVMPFKKLGVYLFSNAETYYVLIHGLT